MRPPAAPDWAYLLPKVLAISGAPAAGTALSVFVQVLMRQEFIGRWLVRCFDSHRPQCAGPVVPASGRPEVCDDASCKNSST